MSNRKKSIGILGGMGPDASAYFYELMIQKSRSDFHAVNNDDYPDIILHSVPVPDFISNQKYVKEALQMLQESTRHIAPFCSVMGIACNTAHLLLSNLQSETNVPFVSMIEETAKYLNKSGYKQIGLLATPITFQTKLYQKALYMNGVTVLTPDASGITELGHIVNSIVSGEFSESGAKTIKIADTLVARGAEAIVLGCTELPLVFSANYKRPIISSLDVLATSLLTQYYGGIK